MRHRAVQREQLPEQDQGISSRSNAAIVTARRSRQLERILETMPAPYRVVFVMFELEGLSCEQIAEAVGSPVGTVYSRLHRARQFFERALHRLGAARIE